MESNETILKPDFDNLYAQFTRESKLQAAQLFTDMPSSDCAEMAEKRDALRAVQAVLAPINIALQCATTVEKIQEMRVWLAEIVTVIQARADALDNDLNGRANEYSLCFRLNNRECVEATFLAETDAEAITTGEYIRVQGPSHSGAEYFVRDSAGNRIDR